jgi:hypothetical protein
MSGPALPVNGKSLQLFRAKDETWLWETFT